MTYEQFLDTIGPHSKHYTNDMTVRAAYNAGYDECLRMVRQQLKAVDEIITYYGGKSA